MIEEIILKYIKSKLNIPAFLVAPSDKPSKYITIRKSASSGDRFIENAMIIFYCISQESLFEASQINSELKKALYDMPYEVNNVSGVYINSDGNFTDTTTKEYRYQAIYEVIYHL